MSNVIKNNAVIEDTWLLIREQVSLSELPQGYIIVSLAVWQANKTALLARGNTGVWLDSTDDPNALRDDLAALPIIAINFPTFMDGRGYSSARILRDHFKYEGEIRAFGDVLRDQLFYMKRCGFDAFVLRDNDRSAEALASLNDFANTYQAAADDADPLFKRRA